MEPKTKNPPKPKTRQNEKTGSLIQMSNWWLPEEGMGEMVEDGQKLKGKKKR